MSVKEDLQSQIIRQKTAHWQVPEFADMFIKNTNEKYQAGTLIWQEVANKLFLEYCRPNSNVLDVGSGHGNLSKFLAQNGCRKVVACDISQPLLDNLSKQGLPNIEIRRGDAHHLPANDDEFDTVVSRMFLSHFPDWQDILAEMVRCCRPNGRIIYTFLSGEHRQFAELTQKRPCEFDYSPDANQGYGAFSADCTVEELLALCKKFRLNFVALHPFGFFNANMLMAYSIGTEVYQRFKATYRDSFKSKDVRDFIIWFEETVVRHLPAFMTYHQVVVLEKR